MRDNTREFIKFVIARHAIYVARKSKREWPWTKDPILRQYKFCNIYRELDRVTRWISANWRQPNQNDPDFWFAAFLARRCINLPATLSVVGYPIPWKPDVFLDAIECRSKMGKRVFNSDAYKVIVSGQSGDLAEVQVRTLLKPVWAARNELRPRRDDTLMAFHIRLASIPFVGNFYSAHVVADAKYVGLLRNASDWWHFKCDS